MKRHLDISRPKPLRGPVEESVSFSLRLLTWYDEQFRRGWALEDLPVLTVEELSCLAACRQQLGMICAYCELMQKAKGGAS